MSLIPEPGGALIRACWIGTIVFVVTAATATADPDGLGWPGIVVSLVLFAAGAVAMLMAFFAAVERSRTQTIAVGGLYFGAGSTPRIVRWHLLGATAIQLAVGLTTASIRPFTVVAFGTLVPIFGLGLMGLWTARHGQFPEREPDPKR
jgi:hypothetical protein